MSYLHLDYSANVEKLKIINNGFTMDATKKEINFWEIKLINA